MEKNPYIGQMDRLINVQKEVKTKNSTGEEEATYQDVARVYAFMEEQSGDDDVEGKVRHLITRAYTIRYHAAIAANGNTFKVLDAGVMYDIYHVKEIGRKKHLKLLVTNYE